MGDGSTTEFSFNFPYFENSNIIVTKNNITATGYSIIGTSSAPDADIPYTGGKIVFENAPTTLDSITISRSLPLTRIVDYQPTAKLEPTTLNQDANYLMEIIKDLQDELDSLCAQYADIADKESTTTLLARISAIHDEIVMVSAQITALGDISEINANITNLKNASNFTETGKTAITHLSMPGTRFDDLTLGTSGTKYVAPADGWFCLMMKSDQAGEYCNLYVEDANEQYLYGITNHATNRGYNQGQMIPVSQGFKLHVVYTMSGSVDLFRFIYANNIS